MIVETIVVVVVEVVHVNLYTQAWQALWTLSAATYLTLQEGRPQYRW